MVTPFDDVGVDDDEEDDDAAAAGMSSSRNGRTSMVNDRIIANRW